MFLYTFALLVGLVQGPQAVQPAAVEGNFLIKDFQFTSGETLPELRIHYRTLRLATEERAGAGRATLC